MCECHPLQTQHFFIFLFASFNKWLILLFFVNLCYSYSMEHRLSLVLLVTLTGWFGFQVSARQQNSAAQLLLNSNGANHCELVCLHTLKKSSKIKKPFSYLLNRKLVQRWPRSCQPICQFDPIFPRRQCWISFVCCNAFSH